jgi:hypothetical protein
VRQLRLAVVFLFAAAAPSEEPFSVNIDLRSGEDWKSVDAATVFTAGQEIRFRVRSATPGYLYLLDETPLGEQRWIYPEEDGVVRRMQPAREYIVPTDGSYRIGAQPGYDILYWVISPGRLAAVPQLPIRQRPRPTTKLLPRCGESTLRARGICVDTRAGVQPTPSREAAELSKQLTHAVDTHTDAVQNRTTAAREPGSAVLTASGRVVIYEMRLAHK